MKAGDTVRGREWVLLLRSECCPLPLRRRPRAQGTLPFFNDLVQISATTVRAAVTRMRTLQT